MKDIFIDSNIAKNFATPADPNYKELIKWLKHYDEESVKNDKTNHENFAHLVVSQKLLNEYLRSSRDCSKPSSIPILINILLREGRLIKIKAEEIKNFKKKYFSKKVISKLESNREDHFHIITVLKSHRKMCLTIDDNFSKDLHNFPKFTVNVEKRPENLNYK